MLHEMDITFRCNCGYSNLIQVSKEGKVDHKLGIYKCAKDNAGNTGDHYMLILHSCSCGFADNVYVKCCGEGGYGSQMQA